MIAYANALQDLSKFAEMVIGDEKLLIDILQERVRVLEAIEDKGNVGNCLTELGLA
jgi:hypothetical protein